jgi:hypothetical protein
LGSGNLGLVYLMAFPGRATREEIDERHPGLLEALRHHEHLGWLLVHSERHGPLVLGPAGTRRLEDGQVEGADPLAPFGPSAGGHILRTSGFAHCPDILVGSFYDPEMEEGCAFEELISFHGGLGGPQTRPFVLYPAGRLSAPADHLVGAAAIHRLLTGWRAELQGAPVGAGAADRPLRPVPG